MYRSSDLEFWWGLLTVLAVYFKFDFVAVPGIIFYVPGRKGSREGSVIFNKRPAVMPLLYVVYLGKRVIVRVVSLMEYYPMEYYALVIGLYNFMMLDKV